MDADNAVEMAELGLKHLDLVEKAQQLLFDDPNATTVDHLRMANEWLRLIATAMTKSTLVRVAEDLSLQLERGEADLEALQSRLAAGKSKGTSDSPE